MKVYLIFFSCFHLMKISVFGVTQTIPQEWKKNSKPIPIIYHKPSNDINHNNFLHPQASSYKLPHEPIIAPEVETQITEPEITNPFALPQNQQIHPDMLKPQRVTKPDTMYVKIMPNRQIKPIVVFSKNIENKYEDENKTNNNQHNEKNELNESENNKNMITLYNNNSIISEEARTDEHKDDNRSVTFFNNTTFDYLKQENREANFSMRVENHQNDNNKNYEETSATNNLSTTQNDKDSDKSKELTDALDRKSDIEVIINDPDVNVLIFRQNHKKTVPISIDKFPNVSDQNQITSGIDFSPGNSVQENGRFVTDQYRNSISDADNYANVYQIENDTKGNNIYDNTYIQYEASSLPNAENVKINRVTPDYLNNKSWRTVQNKDWTIKNNPKKIKLYLTHCSPSSKYFFNKDYNNQNNVKLYYPRC